MRCISCDGETKVVESRSAYSPPASLTGPLIHAVRKAVDWYTRDWTARRRVCVVCGIKMHTVELLVDDLEYMQTEGKPPPDCL